MTATVKIRVSIEARTALNQLGSKGETYDTIIRRLIKYRIYDYNPREAAPIVALLDGREEEAE